MTEVTILYTDSVVPWYQTAESMLGYVWCEQGGQVVAGSQFSFTGGGVPAPVQPLQTGNTTTDILNFILGNIQAMSGVAPTLYNYPGAVGGDWGATGYPMPNALKGRPFVALAYNEGFTFGPLNIPTRAAGGDRIWRFTIFAFGNSEVSTPSYFTLDQYADDNAGAAPTLWALELRPE
jgi:hypothetical protein